MKKDLDWLVQRIHSEREQLAQSFTEGKETDDESAFNDGKDKALSSVLRLIDQLDEPEVLSQELPVIPEIVAEWYESEGRRSSWWNWFYKWGRDESRTKLESKTIRWMQDYNEEKFVDIFKRGYKVEEERKYNVKFKVKSLSGTVGIFLYKRGDEVLAGDNFRAYYPKEDKYRLTEQEIRDFQNGDILFEHFAVKVEESEE